MVVIIARILDSRPGWAAIGVLVTALVMGLPLWSLSQGNKVLRADLASATADALICNANNAVLMAAGKRQNEQIEQMAAIANDITTRANASAGKVLESGRKAQERDAVVGDSPEEMNAWLREVFSP